MRLPTTMPRCLAVYYGSADHINHYRLERLQCTTNQRLGYYNVHKNKLTHQDSQNKCECPRECNASIPNIATAGARK